MRLLRGLRSQNLRKLVSTADRHCWSIFLGSATYRMPLILDVGWALRDLGVVCRDIIIQILLVVNRRDCGAETPRHGCKIGPGALDRADAETIAEEQLLVESSYEPR